MNKHGSVAQRRLCTLMSIALTIIAADVCAEDVPRFAEPPLLSSQAVISAKNTAQKLRVGTNLFSAGAESAAIKAGREIHYVLPIKYTDGTINNPVTGKNDPVHLRSFGDSFVAPTIVMKPGQTVRIGLKNELPAEPKCGEGKGINQPHCFNITNLHSHGLWVSPAGNSDNVLLSLHPGVSFEYEYNVPEDHPAGTFWYHPHKHGSTAMQVGSGMAGVLVVKGDRMPTSTSNGDLDVLLKPFEPAGGDYAEVILFQQIPYACFNSNNEIEKDDAGHWICKEGQVGKVEDFVAQLNFGTWGPSGRHTLINGRARPDIAMESGRLYRWRLVHAGIRESIALRIRKIGDSGLLNARALSSADSAAEVSKACTGTDVALFEVAADGLTRAQVFEKKTTMLHPGYRSDVLFALPEQGDYCVYDDSAKPEDTVSAQPENPKVIAIIRARSGTSIKDQKTFLTDQLMASANNFPADVRNQIKGDLRNLLLTRFVPHPDISEQEVIDSGMREVPIEFQVATVTHVVDGKDVKEFKFNVNGADYKPDRIDQTLILGKTQAWRLTAVGASHPFHIHVNPFQIVSVRKKGDDGKPTGPEITDGQYTGMLGTWKDTLLVQPDVVIATRTRYQRYIGEFVLHCHILDHEDQGMMQNVRIVLPDSAGAPTAQGHH